MPATLILRLEQQIQNTKQHTQSVKTSSKSEKQQPVILLIFRMFFALLGRHFLPNPLMGDFHKMGTHTVTILQHLLQNCYCVRDYFVDIVQ